MYKKGDSITAEQAMTHAVRVGQRGAGFVSPNPRVGCVIVDKNHRFVAEGAHLRFGEAHAEINALNAIQDPKDLEDATVYVTLEPCAHEGKTGSCAKALSKLPIKKVVYGVLDPNPLVAGQGLDILKAHGIEVQASEYSQRECEELAEHFLFAMKNKSPFVSLKVGTSLDGKIALKNGESQWITSEEARLHARQLRAHYDATLIGAGTFLKDNPSLDFRDTSFADKKDNKIVLLDPKGKLRKDFEQSKLFEKHQASSIFILTPEAHCLDWKDLSIEALPWGPSKKAWVHSLEELYKKGISSLYVEGGRFVFSELLRWQLAQKLYLYQSSKILGSGMSWSDFFEIKKISNAINLSYIKREVFKDEQLLVGYFSC